MTDELKGFEPVAEYEADTNHKQFLSDFEMSKGWRWRRKDFSRGDKLYAADQLAQVVQQRDELLKSMKYLQEYRLWSNGHAKAIIDSAIAKVQP